jgi:hypothetical protein
VDCDPVVNGLRGSGIVAATVDVRWIALCIGARAGVVAALMAVTSLACSSRSGMTRSHLRHTVVREDLQAVFANANVEGAFALLEVSTNQLTVVNRVHGATSRAGIDGSRFLMRSSRWKLVRSGTKMKSCPTAVVASR